MSKGQHRVKHHQRRQMHREKLFLKKLFAKKWTRGKKRKQQQAP